MLKEVSLWLTEQGFITSVIGRTEEKHDALVNQASRPEFIHRMMVDYNDHPLLEESIRKSMNQFGPISLVVSWTTEFEIH